MRHRGSAGIRTGGQEMFVAHIKETTELLLSVGYSALSQSCKASHENPEIAIFAGADGSAGRRGTRGDIPYTR